MQDPRVDLADDPLPPFALARLGTVRWRHRGMSIDNLIFSGDGTTLFTSGQGLTAIDVSTGEEVGRWKAHSTSVTALALSAGGERVVTLGEDGAVRLSRTHDGAQLASHTTSGVSKGLALSPDGATVAFADGVRVGLLDLATFRERAPTTAHASAVMDLAVGRDGETAVTIGGDRARFWSMRDGRFRGACEVLCYARALRAAGARSVRGDARLRSCHRGARRERRDA